MKYHGVIQRKLTLLDCQVGNLEKHLSGVGKEAFADDWAPLRSSHYPARPQMGPCGREVI